MLVLIDYHTMADCVMCSLIVFYLKISVDISALYWFVIIYLLNCSMFVIDRHWRYFTITDLLFACWTIQCLWLIVIATCGLEINLLR